MAKIIMTFFLQNIVLTFQNKQKKYIFNSHGEEILLQRYLFIAISFYLNIVCKNISCE